MHTLLNEKRFRKLDPLKKRRDLFAIEGDADADVALVAWGSIAGVCHEALAMVRASGVRAKLLVPYLIYPIAEEIYDDFFAGVRTGLVVELSHQGQLYRILRSFVDVPRGIRQLTQNGANPFQPRQVADALIKLASVQAPVRGSAANVGVSQ
jgi:2-oxoglutarate ferredoxin oxidoreductase subunit alpha